MQISERHRQTIENLGFGLSELEVLERYFHEMGKRAEYVVSRTVNAVTTEAAEDKVLWEGLHGLVQNSCLVKRKQLRDAVFTRASEEDGNG